MARFPTGAVSHGRRRRATRAAVGPTLERSLPLLSSFPIPILIRTEIFEYFSHPMVY